MLQDKRFKNRELQIMKMLDHTNVTTLLHYFYTEGDKAEETYLNLVMDFIPQTVSLLPPRLRLIASDCV